jgi:hypothetical protein
VIEAAKRGQAGPRSTKIRLKEFATEAAMASLIRPFRAGLVAALALAGAFTASDFSPQAQAQSLFGGIAGDGCNQMQAEGGVFWQGYFRGREESPFTFDDGLYVVREYRCFRTLEECDAWLYAVQSAHVVTHRTWCRQYAS